MRLRGTKMSNQGHCALLLARVLLAEIPSLSVFHTGLKKKKKKKKSNIKSIFCFPLEKHHKDISYFTGGVAGSKIPDPDRMAEESGGGITFSLALML